MTDLQAVLNSTLVGLANVFSSSCSYLISLCIIVPPVPPTLAIQVVNATATDDTRVLAHIGSLVSITCKMTEAYTQGNLQVHWSADTGINIPQTRLSLTEVNLNIDSAAREDDGRYTCHAANDLGSISMSVNIVVGSVPESPIITATSTNDTLIVMWEQQNTTEDHDQQIIAYYVQYISVNSSNNVVVVERFAASVQKATLQDVERDVEYIVTVWSENGFGNSSESDNMSVVIIGMFI